jgi:hypothetical protein
VFKLTADVSAPFCLPRFSGRSGNHFATPAAFSGIAVKWLDFVVAIATAAGQITRTSGAPTALVRSYTIQSEYF